MDAATRQEMMAEYGAFTQSIIQSGHFKAGDGLQPTTTATTVRVRDGKTLTTDGPFAETREQLGGYYLVEAKDLDTAIAIAARIPGAQGRLDRGQADHGSMIDRGSLVARMTTRSNIEKIFRDEAGRAMATLIRLVGDFDLAEDVLQDAFAVALERWPQGELPSNPRAWLVNVGRNKAIDRIRRNIAFRGKQQQLAHEIELNAVRAERSGRRRARRRHAAADLHLLPSVLCAGGAGGADLAHGVRIDHRAGRARIPCQRGRDGAAPVARQAEDPSRRHSLSRCRSATRWRRGCAACSR